jgi:adenine-specific DNA-methyltransferase
MTNNKQKLELTWIGKNNPEYDIANIEPRILEERTDLSYGDPNTANIIIHGDNLLALKALLPEYEGKVKCIYIDPPYNTGSAFAHYDDSVEHSTWLSLMKPRLNLLHKLLSNNGSIWISIDDNEMPYLRILLDEVFGRENFIATVLWQKKYGAKSDSKFLSESHEYVICYAKNIENVLLNRMQRTAEQDARYKNPDNDLRGPWTSGDLLRNEVREYAVYPIIGPSGRSHLPPQGTSWRFTKEKFAELVADSRIWFGETGDNVPRLKRFLNEVSQTVPAITWWEHTGVGHNDEAKKESKLLFGNQLFATPKPERLMERVISLSSNSNDLILDSFAGSGTTAAVAHKMGRKYIAIEMGGHASTHIQTRLRKVVDGNDGLKLSETLDWKGGGGFKYYELAPSFISIDAFGNPVIDSYYNDSRLIKAMCKLTNYTFAPSKTEYWKQGKGQGSNYIFVTTQMLSIAMVQQIVSHLGPNESLLICPKKYEPGCKEVDPRITIKKIPQSVLKACQFGKKEYLLPIKESAMEELDEEDLSETQE